MECILLVGIQGAGKSTFYKRYFFHTHMRINLDMLKSRHREDIFLAASFQSKQKIVVDNTNPRETDRWKYIQLAKKFDFKVIGYFFQPDLESSLQRNDSRKGKQRVPIVAIRDTLKKLEVPRIEEGFNELYQVTVRHDEFIIAGSSMPGFSPSQ